MLLDDDFHEDDTDIKLTDKDIFLKIWTSPRLVIKYINDNNYDKYVTILLILGGISRTIDRASMKNMGDNLPLTGVLATTIIVGGLLGWISYYIYSALISWTGKWIGGKGDTQSLLKMTAHASIPSILALVLLIPQILIYGNGIFQSTIDVYSVDISLMFFFYFTVFLEVLLGVWTMVIFTIGVSEVQKISIGKSILNIFLPILVIVIPLAIIVVVISGAF